MAAVGRHIAALMTEPECVRLVEACEELANGAIDSDTFCDLHTIGQAANDYIYLILDDYKHNECIYMALDALGDVAATEAGVLERSATRRRAEAVWKHPVFIAGKQDAEQTFLGYLHDVFGPDPYKPVKVVRAWRTTTAVSLARSMDTSRDFSAMPVLADALQEAGCEHPAVLNHCRDPKASHVRGCWVIDLVLGKK
jgi:hypothetical protein